MRAIILVLLLVTGCADAEKGDMNATNPPDASNLPDISCAQNYFLCSEVKNNSTMLLCQGRSKCELACYQCINDGVVLPERECRIYSESFHRTVGFCVADCANCPKTN